MVTQVSIALNFASLNSLPEAVVDPDEVAVVMLGGAELTARLHADTKARPGELSTFLVDMAKVCLFDPKSERRII